MRTEAVFDCGSSSASNWTIFPVIVFVTFSFGLYVTCAVEPNELVVLGITICGNLDAGNEAFTHKISVPTKVVIGVFAATICPTSIFLVWTIELKGAVIVVRSTLSCALL